MEKKKSTVTRILGFVFLFVGLVPGISLLSLGILGARQVGIDTATGYDATGLGIIFAYAFIIIGIICSCFLFFAVSLLGLKSKQVVIAAIIFALIPGVLGRNSDEGRKSWEKQTRNTILAQIEKNKYAYVTVTCRVLQEAPIEISGNSEAIQAFRRKFIVENIIKPLEPENILDYSFYKWANRDMHFSARVTKLGYESLKQNIHILKIVPSSQKPSNF